MSDNIEAVRWFETELRHGQYRDLKAAPAVANGIRALLAEHDANTALTVTPVWAILQADGKLAATANAPIDSFSLSQEALEGCDTGEKVVRLIVRVVESAS